MSWDVVDLSTWSLWQQETEGDNEKQWYINPDTGERWLFKPNRPDRSPLKGHAEVIASRIAGLLDVPAAHVELATFEDELGCLSRNVISYKDNEEIKPDQILANRVEDYDPRAKVRVGHNRSNISDILRRCEPPRVVAHSQQLGALDWFAIYLFFDALIGNVDRHSSNWSLEIDWNQDAAVADDRPFSPVVRLLPTFDHASSLGASMRGIGLQRLVTSTVNFKNYPFKATAGRFEDGVGTSLVDYAASYLTACSNEGRTFIEEQFCNVRRESLEDIIESAELGEASTTLANTIVGTNAERILACLSRS